MSDQTETSIPVPPSPSDSAKVRPARRSRRGMQDAGLLMVILLLGLFLFFFSDPITLADGRSANAFFRLDNLIGNVALPMSWMAIMAAGVTFVIISGGIDISIGSIFGLAALGTTAVLQHFDANASAWVVLPTAFGVALGIGLICGLINGALVVGLRMHPFIVTLGTLSIFRGIGLISVPTKSLPSGDLSLPPAFTDRFISWTTTMGSGSSGDVLLSPVPVIIMLLCVTLAWLYLSCTAWGREIYAVGGNEEAARFSGLRVGWIKMRVYVISGLSAGLAGMVSCGFFQSANTATGEGYELTVIAAAVVGGASLSGGRGTALGALLGTLVIQLIDNGISILKHVNLGFAQIPVSREYTKIIIGIAIIVAVAIDRFSEYIRRRRLAKAGAK